MGQIGHGYGSEFQLMRFMGHHRHELEQRIRKAISVDQKLPFNWIDFEYADRERSISGDAELTGLSFLKNTEFKEYYECVEQQTRNLEWNFERWQNWDAVFILDGVLYLVEAKAHKDELRSGSKLHGGTHSQDILKFMQERFPQATDKWLTNYYQLANRLATVSLLNSNGIPTKLLNIFFVDGYFDRARDIIRDTSEKQFENEIKLEKSELKISDEEYRKYVVEVFVDANPQ